MKYQWFKCSECRDKDIEDRVPDDDLSAVCIVCMQKGTAPYEFLCIMDKSDDAKWEEVTKTAASKL